MKRIKKIFSFLWKHKILTAIGIVILLVIGFILRPKPATPVQTQTLKPADITETVSVSGSVIAKNTANLSFPIGGTISWVGVKAGDTVTEGQTVATLDQRTALKNLQKALLNYSLQRDTFDQNIANNNGIGSPVDALNDTMKRILQDNQYNLDLAVNSVELQDLAKQQSVLWTPINGIVTAANVTSAGTTAVLGSTLFTVTDPTSTVFSMDVDEADIGKIALGQNVQLTLDAYPNEALTLPVNFIDFVSHKTTNGGDAFSVQVKLDNTSGYRYRVGMNGDANIIVAERKNVLTIPLASVVNDNQVYVKEGKKYVKRTISLGIQSDTDAEVTSGLHEGDVVAIDPTQVTKK